VITIRLTILAALALAFAYPIHAQQSDDDYGARCTEFCSTRKAARADSPHSPSAPPMHPRPSSTGGAHRLEAPAPEAPTASVRLGLGYTVYKRSGSGAPVRVDPGSQFVDGDAIRVVLESNVDGYLYIFNTDSTDRNATMIYPQVRLRGGENFVEAHVPVEIPSRKERDPANQWLILADGPVVDRLYFVVTEQPLADVPTGDALRRFCGESSDCYWKPSASAWTALHISAGGDVRTAASRSYGQTMAASEDDAIEGRTVRLAPQAPAPAAIAMGSTPDVRMVVTAVDLTHRAKP
jgi:hypothetical protein